jgi:hypothetical protein
MDEMTADLISEGTLEGLESARARGRRRPATRPDGVTGAQSPRDVRRTRSAR